MNGTKYSIAFLKKAGKVYLPALFVSLLISAILLFFAARMLDSHDATATARFQIGLVGDTESDSLKMGVSLLQNLDTSRFAIELVPITEQSAHRKVLQGEMEGYIRIPDHFEEDISHGRKTTVSYVSKQETSTFGSAIVHEIAELVADMTLKSQSAVFSLWDIDESGNWGKGYEATEQASITYITEALGRSGMSDVTVLGVSDGLTMNEYYFCSVLVVLLLLWGIACSGILFKKDLSIQKLLFRNGVSATKQTGCEYAVYLLLSLLYLLILFVAVGIVSDIVEISVPELSQGASAVLSCFIRCIPVVILFTSLQFLVYELIDSRIAAVLLLFFLTVVAGYLSGCFYPSYFFPETLQKVAALLPVGTGFSYLKGVVGLTVPSSVLWMTVLYSAFFLGLSVVFRRYRLAGDRS